MIGGFDCPCKELYFGLGGRRTLHLRFALAGVYCGFGQVEIPAGLLVAVLRFQAVAEGIIVLETAAPPWGAAEGCPAGLFDVRF